MLPFLSTLVFPFKTVHVFVGKEGRELKYQKLFAGTNKSSSNTTVSREVLTSKLT